MKKKYRSGWKGRKLPKRAPKTEQHAELILRSGGGALLKVDSLLQALQAPCISYTSQPMALRLADATTYTTDFMINWLDLDGAPVVMMLEIKGGFERDDARAKFKIATELYPHFLWLWLRLDQYSTVTQYELYHDAWKRRLENLLRRQ